MINISVKFVIWMLCYCMIFQQSASFLQSIVKCSNALGRTEPLRMVGGNKASNIGVSNIIKSLADSQVSLGAGAAGYMVLLVNRLLQSSETALTASNDIALRDDLLSIMACSALLLNALSEQEVQIKQRDRIPLLGYAYSSPVLASTLQSEDKRAAKWLLESTLQVNPCISSVAIIDANTEIVAGCGVLGRNGIIGSKVEESQLPILRKVLDSQGEEVYLPDLQILPGKIEFSYFPINAQSICIFPLHSAARRRALVIATNQAKNLKFKDLNKLRALCDIYNAMG